MSAIVINSQMCSDSFNAAFASLEAGRDIRRECWPANQFLRLEKTGLVAVYREGRMSSPAWIGPSSFETDAEDWQVI